MRKLIEKSGEWGVASGGRKAVSIFLFFCLLLPAATVYANNTAVENVSLVDKDTGANTCDIKLDISWDNSWFIAGAPSATANWDAVWVFAKYSVYSGGIALTAANSVNSLNNLNWNFGGAEDSFFLFFE